jgi:hypothetical protein
MENPRLSWLDQQRLIAERDLYRKLLEETQKEYEDFKKLHQYCSPDLPDLDNMEF